jgi:hypothetical protein
MGIFFLDYLQSIILTGEHMEYTYTITYSCTWKDHNQWTSQNKSCLELEPGGSTSKYWIDALANYSKSPNWEGGPVIIL